MQSLAEWRTNQHHQPDLILRISVHQSPELLVYNDRTAQPSAFTT